MGNIKSKEAKSAAEWDWSFLNGCFGDNGIRVGDIDGFVEHNWNFLILEGKPRDKELFGGQKTALTRFASFPIGTVIVVKGDSKTTTIDEVCWISSLGTKTVKGNVELAQKWVNYWYNYAHWHAQSAIPPPEDCYGIS